MRAWLFPQRASRRTLLMFVVLIGSVFAGSTLTANVSVAARAPSMRSVSNPPAHVPRTLQLRVSGSARFVTVYASKGRRVTKSSVRLSRRAAVRKARISVTVPSSLRAGLWFVVVCPAGKTSGCAASHTAMFKAPKTFARPVQATPVADRSRAVIVTIGSKGGVINVTAKDGTKLRLSVAAKSVPDGTRITMTPLSSLTSAKWFGKLIGGVQLQPEGLLLVHGATLTVTPKKRVPARNWVPVGYTGNGADVHLVPLARSQTSIQIPISHFSGFGAGNSTSGGAGAPTGGTASGWFESQLLDLLKQAQDGSTSEGDFEKAANKVFEEWYQQIMSTQVPPGMNEDNAARRAIQSLLEWARVAELYGNGGALGRVAPTVRKLLDGIYKRAQKKCASEHDLTQVSKILDTDRQLELMGGGHGITEDMKCMRFQVEFDSTMIITDTENLTQGSFTLEYAAKPTIQYGSNGLISGEGPGYYAQASGTLRDPDNPEESYWSVTSGSGGTIGVQKFDIDVNGSGPATLVIGIGAPPPTETYQTKDGGGPGGFWNASWAKLHESENIGWLFALQLERGYPSSTLIARKSWSGSASIESGLQVNETTTIEVYHTPPATS